MSYQYMETDEDDVKNPKVYRRNLILKSPDKLLSSDDHSEAFKLKAVSVHDNVSETIKLDEVTSESDQDMSPISIKSISSGPSLVKMCRSSKSEQKNGVSTAPNLDSISENEEWREAFAIFDHNSDGYLDDAEFANALRTLGVALSNAAILDLLKGIASKEEVKENGVSWEEFKEIMLTLSKTTEAQKKLSFENSEIIAKLEIFQKDGFIDIAHIRLLLTEYAEKMTPAEVDQLLKGLKIEGLRRVKFQPDFVNLFLSSYSSSEDYSWDIK